MELKQWLTSAPVLIMPDQTKPFQIECDASKYASRVILTQLDSNGDHHPIAFLSKNFSEMECNYEMYDRELLAIIWALEEWQHYIQGSGHTTVIYSDHQNLTYFRSAQKCNLQQARRSFYLSKFDVKLIHQPGSKMIQSDTLSQWPDFILGRDTNNENMTLLPEHLFLNLFDITLQDRVLDLGQIDDFLRTFSITDLPFGDAGDWKLKQLKEKTHCLTREGIIFWMTWICGETFCECCMIMKLWDILVRQRLWCWWSGITGGLAYAHLYGTMWRVVLYVSNIRLTDHLPILCIHRFLPCQLHSLLLIVL